MTTSSTGLTALIASVAALALTACAAQSAPRPAPPPETPFEAAVSRGQSLVQQVCAQCHSLTGVEAVPPGQAPPFPTLQGRYTELTLQRHFAKLAETGDSAMPSLKIDSDQTADLIAYLNRATAGAARR